MSPRYDHQAGERRVFSEMRGQGPERATGRTTKYNVQEPVHTLINTNITISESRIPHTDAYPCTDIPV
jgi:hypothetical protein